MSLNCILMMKIFHKTVCPCCFRYICSAMLDHWDDAQLEQLVHLAQPERQPQGISFVSKLVSLSKTPGLGRATLLSPRPCCQALPLQRGPGPNPVLLRLPGLNNMAKSAMQQECQMRGLSQEGTDAD